MSTLHIYFLPEECYVLLAFIYEDAAENGSSGSFFGGGGGLFILNIPRILEPKGRSGEKKLSRRLMKNESVDGK